MFSLTSLRRFTQQEGGSEKHSSKPTDFQLHILTSITIMSWKLALVTCKEAAKRVGLNFYEIQKQA